MDKLRVFSKTIEVLKTMVRFEVRQIFRWGTVFQESASKLAIPSPATMSF